MTFFFRRILLASLLALTGLSGAQAQDYPTKPVRLVVGFPPGGMADIMARALAEKLAPHWKQAVVVENRPGASGTIAGDVAAKAAPDGYTLLVILTNHVIAAAVQPKLPYDSLADFSPITLVGKSPLLLLANPKLPANNLGELIALAKSKPGTVSYSTPGDDSVHHLSMELLNTNASTKMLHVPYTGGSQAMMDAIGGVVNMNIGSPAQALQQVRAGKLKAVGFTGEQRSSLLPEVPTVAESGYPGFEAALWAGVLAPAKTPKALIAKIQADIKQVMSAPDVKEKMTKIGVDMILSTPETFDQYMRSELTKWGTVAKQAGVKGK